MKTTLRQLEVFLSVAKTGSVSRSAEDLLLTQSAVSMSLAELERALGGDLFDRPGKRLQLNDRGRLLLPRALEICNRMEEVTSMLQPQDREAVPGTPVSGSLRIAASSTAGNYLIPGIMGAFVEKHPQVSMSLDVKNSREVIQSVLQFEADAGFVEGIAHNPDLDVSPWRKDRLVVIAASGHPLSRKKHLEPADLEESGWIMRERGSGTREIFEKAIGGSIHKLRLILELGHSEAVKSAVASSLAISCLSRLTVERDIEYGRLAELKTPFLDLERNFFLVLHREKYRTGLLRAFLDYAAT